MPQHFCPALTKDSKGRLERQHSLLEDSVLCEALSLLHISLCVPRTQDPDLLSPGPLLRAVYTMRYCLPSRLAHCFLRSSRFPGSVSHSCNTNLLHVEHPSGPIALPLWDSKAKGTDANMPMLMLCAREQSPVSLTQESHVSASNCESVTG